MNNSLNPSHKKIEEFRNKFCNYYPGDSGLGGNDPQEPVYEWATDAPWDVEKWLLEAFKEIESDTKKEIKEKINKIGRVRAEHNGEYFLGFDERDIFKILK